MKVKRSDDGDSDAKIAELMEKMMRASAADVPTISEQIQEALRKQNLKKDLKQNMKKNEEESMKRWEEEAEQWRKQQEEEAKQAKKSAEAVSVKPKETGVKPVKKDKLSTKKDRTKQTPDDMLKELIKKGQDPERVKDIQEELQRRRVEQANAELPLEKTAVEKAENRKQATKMKREADEKQK